MLDTLLIRNATLACVFALSACATTFESSASTSVSVSARAASPIDAEPTADDVERVRVPVADAPVRGTGQLVTIVQFSDFECPFCSRVTPTMERLLARYPAEVRVVFRHYPLPFHRSAEPAAIAAIEVRAQLGDEGFWRFHDRLFENSSRLSTANLVEFASDVGADPDAVRRAIEGGAHQSVLNDDRALAAQVRVTGTPAQFINGRPLMGAQPYEAFAAMVEEEIALARSRGAQNSSWYETLLADAPSSRAPPPPREEARDRTVFRVPVAHSPSQGREDALVTLVAFTDFECPFCARALGGLEALREHLGDELRVVFRHYPLPFHRNAMGAHEAAQEAFVQGGNEAFWAMHDRLFAHRTALEPEQLEGHAQAVGLDLQRFRAAMADHRHRAVVEADIAVARSLGVRGTPTFFLNGRRLVGARPAESFVALGDEVSAVAQAHLDRGVSRGDLYAALMEEATNEEPAEAPEGDELPAVPPVPDHAPRKGGNQARVTIQVFSDFECPFCGRINPTLERVLEQYGDQVQVVFRHMPLRNHRHAELAAEAAIEVRAQLGDAAFWRFHDRLFANQRALTRDDLLRHGVEVGADRRQLERALDNHRHRSQVAADQRAARAMGVRGTPTAIVGRRIVRGARPFLEFEELLDELLED
ncbi:MAG: DsbA family protein [Myxococcota bacterium]